MRTRDFLEKYPEWRETYDKRERRIVPGGVQTFVNAICNKCGCTFETRWQPTVVRDKNGDGTVLCRVCGQLLSVKMKKEHGWWESEEFREQHHRGALTRKESGYYRSEKFAEVRRRGFNTSIERGTFLRSYMELQIEEEFGGQHSSPGFIFELDCYFPELNKGIEVDDPSHYESDNPSYRQKRKGYHKEKDEYFKGKGITVLHLTFNHGDWKERVQSFLDGTYTGPLIDLNDPTYGDIIYEDI